MNRLHGIPIALVLALLALVFPDSGLACDYGYNSIPMLFDTADAVFIGKVIESPWKQGADGTIAVTGRAAVRVSVVKKLKGAGADSLSEGAEARLAGGLGDCRFIFLEGETYLVHAFRTNGELDSGASSRPLRLSEASEALKYIEGIPKQLGMVYGRWTYLIDRDGKTIAIPENRKLILHLEAKGEHLQSAIPPGPWPEVAAPAGEYQAWLELDGKVISERKSVRITPGQAVFTDLVGKLEQ
jgi:hypothetical protein